MSDNGGHYSGINHPLGLMDSPVDKFLAEQSRALRELQATYGQTSIATDQTSAEPNPLDDLIAPGIDLTGAEQSKLQPLRTAEGGESERSRRRVQRKAARLTCSRWTRFSNAFPAAWTFPFA
jgi:hypothetical protein